MDLPDVGEWIARRGACVARVRYSARENGWVELEHAATVLRPAQRIVVARVANIPLIHDLNIDDVVRLSDDGQTIVAVIYRRYPFVSLVHAVSPAGFRKLAPEVRSRGMQIEGRSGTCAIAHVDSTALDALRDDFSLEVASTVRCAWRGKAPPRR